MNRATLTFNPLVPILALVLFLSACSSPGNQANLNSPSLAAPPVAPTAISSSAQRPSEVIRATPLGSEGGGSTLAERTRRFYERGTALYESTKVGTNLIDFAASNRRISALWQAIPPTDLRFAANKACAEALFYWIDLEQVWKALETSSDGKSVLATPAIETTWSRLSGDRITGRLVINRSLIERGLLITGKRWPACAEELLRAVAF